ncbi:MFS transporter [Streptomyces sp. NRRL F-2580]|uniref:MFS transporter n=1 Tax=Streptomyces sp. NRRL F-2580 TaxID=1463841 RepID=UPI0004C604FB|nr:MFS transporter [Streptomyces sp. NRRL F-2580]
MTHLLAVVVIQGVATVFFDLATQSFVKDLAPGSLLARTNARLATITQTAVVAGPPLAGWAAGLLSAPTVLLVMAGGYLWSAGWLSVLTTREHSAGSSPRRRLLHEIGEGVVFVFRQPVLRTVVVSGSMVNIGTAGVMTLLPVLALTELGQPSGWPNGSGQAEPSCSWGSRSHPLAVAIPLLGRPVPGPLAAIGWALVMLKVGFDSVLMMTFRQQVTPAGLMARVNGTMRVLFTGAVALGSATAGALATAGGVRCALGVSAACLARVWIPIALSPLRRMTTLGTHR